MDKKGIFTFLAVTLSLSVTVQFVVMMTPLGWAYYALLVIPVVGVFAARRVSPAPDGQSSTLWPVPKIPAIRIAIVAPLVFAAAYAVTTLAGISQPDWRLSELMAKLQHQAPASAANAFEMQNFSMVMLVLGFLLSTLLGPTFFALLSIGVEYGWRGYLLPRLMPLGRWRAYGALGLMWALSLTPLRISDAAHPALGLLLLHLGMMIVLSAILGEVWNRTHNIGLTAVVYGCYTSQANGMLPFLFPESRVLFPWAGVGGIVAVAAWVIVAAFPRIFFGRLEPESQAQVSVPAKQPAEQRGEN